MTLEKHSRIVRCDTISQAQIGPEDVVLLSSRQDYYYHLDSTSQRIWEFLSEETSVAGLVARLVEEYDVEANECLAQTLEFCRHLDAEGLLIVADAKD